MTEIKPKVLIIDDDKFLQDMYSLKFTKKGYEVFNAVNGNDAITKLKDGLVPDVIVVDIIMPIMNGLKFLEALRTEKLAPEATVVVLTNQGQHEDIEAAEKWNIDGYIIKALAIPSEVIDQVHDIHQKKQGK